MTEVDDIVEQFRAAMREKDIVVEGVIHADGVLHRIKADGDKGTRKNAWYVLHIDDSPAGAFGHNAKYGNTTKFGWKAKQETQKMSAAEWAEQKKVMEARKKAAADERRARQAESRRVAGEMYEAADDCESHDYLTSKGVRAVDGLRVGKWEMTHPDTGQINIVDSRTLLVPMWNTKREVQSLQGIFRDAENNILHRGKAYLAGGVKEGHFFSMGSREARIVVIVEGLATGLSVYECTGYSVIVAFDAGNMLPVAKAVRAALPPEMRLVIGADNDQFTLKPVPNPGVYFATAAAAAVEGHVAIPIFTSLNGKPTDFNDLHQREGAAIVKSLIDAAAAKYDEEPPKKPSMSAPPARSDDDDTDEDDDETDDEGASNGSEEELGPASNGFFTILGYNHGDYFFFHHGKRQVMQYSKSDFHDSGFIELGELSWWETHFMGNNGGINKNAAVNFLMRVAEKRGIYNPDLTRGRGAWVDDGRRVYHHGQYLTVDGERVEVTEVRSRYVYELAKPLRTPAETALTDEEGFKILDLVGRFRWVNPGSAALLAGWLVLAPLCGALRWRPHIWIGGNAGSGKSTILEQIISPLLGGLSVYAQGNSTEPGIRQELQSDALPVIWDEAEQNEDGDVRRVQAMVSLIRQASTESQAKTFKGTISGKSMHFHIRSMFCLASIQVGIKHQADVERLSVLSLKPVIKSPDASAEWLEFKDSIYGLIGHDPDIGGRLFRRSLNMLEVILANIETFTEAAARTWGNQRAGDQYGTLLAGTYSLFRSTPATPKDAEDLIAHFDWTEQRESAGSDEGQRALQSLLEAHLRYKGSDMTVYEAICAAADHHLVGSADITMIESVALLQRYGMKIEDGYLMLSNASNELRNLMMGTTFEADWRGILLRIPSSDRNDNKPVRINGSMTKVIRVNLRSVLNDEPQRTVPLDYASRED